VTFDIAGTSLNGKDGHYGIYVARFILWGKGNRALFAMWWADGEFSVDVLWTRFYS
jgi:hypothetical protein